MNQGGMLKPALIGGVLLGILSALPVINLVNCFCCAWVIGGGILAAYLYVKSCVEAVTLGRGVTLGLLTGAIGAAVDLLFSLPLKLLLSGAGLNILEELREQLDQVPTLPPEIKDSFSTFLSSITGTGLLLMVLAFILAQLILYGTMAMLGGAIGVAVFEKRKPGASTTSSGPTHQPPSDLPPPPPPDPLRD